jgi:predicted DsbA family dithiol-disulfide isomerase
MQLEIWSDIACPWCAVGRANLQRALAAWDQADRVDIRWRSFELDPRAPRATEGSYVDRLAGKYGTSRGRAQEMIDRMVAMGAAAGVTMDFARIRPGNTFDAHRVMHLAADRGIQDAVKGRLLTGYLAEGAPIGDHDAVRSLAVEAGLSGDEVDEVLTTDAYAAAVRSDESTAAQFGISGVPCFVIDRRLGVSGAQPPETLRAALEQGLRDASPLQMVGAHDHAAGDACADGSCLL